MRGSIIKRGAQTYQLRISLGYDKVTGKRRYRHQTVHCARKEAEAALREMVRRHEAGTTVLPDKSSLNEHLLRWLDFKKGQVRDSTMRAYETQIRNHLFDDIGLMPICHIAADDISALYARLQRQGLKASSIRLLQAVLRQVFKAALVSRRLHFNPMSEVAIPRGRREKRPVRAMTREQAASFLCAIKGHFHEAMFALALTTGMRPSEYLGLCWADVDFDAETVTVTKQLVRVSRQQPYLGPPKTPESVRVITVPPPVLTLLRHHGEQQRLQKAFAGPAWAGRDLVFPNHCGGFWCVASVRGIFKTILRAAELPPDLPLYGLRHTCATMLMLAAVNPRVIQDRLGHANVQQTLNTYCYVLPSSQREAAQKLTDMFFSQPADNP